MGAGPGPNIASCFARGVDALAEWMTLAEWGVGAAGSSVGAVNWNNSHMSLRFGLAPLRLDLL
jgi:hypothetical protein